MSDLHDAYRDTIQRGRMIARLSMAKEPAALARRLAILDGKAERLASDPDSLFLPIGAHVRVRKAPDCVLLPNGICDLPGHTPHTYPEAGTEGLVIGPNADCEQPVIALFRTPFRTFGGRTEPEPEGGTLTYLFDADDLEVVSLGTIPGSGECRSLLVLETHHPFEGCGATMRVLTDFGLLSVWGKPACTLTIDLEADPDAIEDRLASAVACATDRS